MSSVYITLCIAALAFFYLSEGQNNGSDNKLCNISQLEGQILNNTQCESCSLVCRKKCSNDIQDMKCDNTTQFKCVCNPTWWRPMFVSGGSLFLLVVIFSLLYFFIRRRTLKEEYRTIRDYSDEEEHHNIQASSPRNIIGLAGQDYSSSSSSSYSRNSSSHETPTYHQPDHYDDPNAPSGNGICVICTDRRSDVVLVPCGHLCLCSLCSKKIIRSETVSGLSQRCDADSEGVQVTGGVREFFWREKGEDVWL